MVLPVTLQEKKSWLMSALSKRKHWESDGKKRYGYGKDEQLGNFERGLGQAMIFGETVK